MPVSHVIVKQITCNQEILSYSLVCSYQGNKVGRLKAMRYARQLAKEMIETLGKDECKEKWDIPSKGEEDNILNVGFKKGPAVYNYLVFKVSGGPVMSPSPRI